MNKLFDEKFIEILRKKILNNEFDTKEKLVEYLRKMNTAVLNDPALIERLKQEGIKINNSDGSYTVLDDSMNDKSFVDQMKDRQNESVDLQTSNGIRNREEIVKDMAKDKEEAKFTTSTEINTRDLTPEERRQFQAVMHLNSADEINFIVDPQRNLYINRDTGETFYVTKNKEGKMEVKRANEQTSETITSDVEYINADGIESEISIDNPADIDLEMLDDSDLQYIRDNRFDSLTPEQQQALYQIMERRKERKQEGPSKVESPKKYTKSLFTRPYNGFSSLIFFTLITLGFCVIYAIYILLSISL